MNVREYLTVIELAGDNFSAYVPDLPGCVAVGDTFEEAEANIKAAIEFHIAGLLEDNLLVPKPSARASRVKVNIDQPSASVRNIQMKIPRLTEVNIKRDWPSVEVARRRLEDEIVRAKKNGVKVMKIIHGYGSTGKGGILRDELRDQLAAMQKSGIVKLVIYGEHLGMFDRVTADLTGKYPELLKDQDYNRNNRGVTIIAF